LPPAEVEDCQVYDEIVDQDEPLANDFKEEAINYEYDMELDESEQQSAEQIEQENGSNPGVSQPLAESSDNDDPVHCDECGEETVNPVPFLTENYCKNCFQQ